MRDLAENHAIVRRNAERLANDAPELVCAAPEMLEALKHADMALEEAGFSRWSGERCAVLSAIARATGEAS